MKTRRKTTKQKRPGIPCPHCANAVSSVTRTKQRGDGLQRIRECSKCHQRFITRESSAKSDTGVMQLATDVTSLVRALGLSPKSFLSPDHTR